MLEEGELVVVTGRTGSGKSTLLGAVNGTVPHFTGGHLSGSGHRSSATTPAPTGPATSPSVVGVVRQDPLAGFVTDTVEEELAYTLEQLALDPPAMRRRVEEVLDLLGIADLRDAPLRDLSGGQQQRVAIGSVLTANPRLLVLDEPTSALDPTGAEEVLATLSRLVHDLGLTVAAVRAPARAHRRHGRPGHRGARRRHGQRRPSPATSWRPQPSPRRWSTSAAGPAGTRCP